MIREAISESYKRETSLKVIAIPKILQFSALALEEGNPLHRSQHSELESPSSLLLPFIKRSQMLFEQQELTVGCLTSLTCQGVTIATTVVGNNFRHIHNGAELGQPCEEILVL